MDAEDRLIEQYPGLMHVLVGLPEADIPSFMDELTGILAAGDRQYVVGLLAQRTKRAAMEGDQFVSAWGHMATAEADLLLSPPDPFE